MKSSGEAGQFKGQLTRGETYWRWSESWQLRTYRGELLIEGRYQQKTMWLSDVNRLIQRDGVKRPQWTRTKIFYSTTSGDPTSTLWREMGFVWDVYTWVVPTRRYIRFGAPLWVAVLPGAFVLLALVRRSRKHKRGLCRVCNYDLRATPDRCPECGTLTKTV